MSQASYELCSNLCGLYIVLWQIILFLVLWNIFFRAERDKKSVILTGIFAVINVILFFGPDAPISIRHVASAVLVLGYCRVKYGRHLGKAVFTLFLFYNFHCMSFLISNSIYQCLTENMMGSLVIWDADDMLLMYKNQMICQSINFLVYAMTFLLLVGIVGRIVKKPFSMNWQEAMFLSALNIVGSMLAWMVVNLMAHAGFPNGLGTSAEKIKEQIANDSDDTKRRLIIEYKGISIGEMSFYVYESKKVEIGIKICNSNFQEKGLGRVILSMLIEELFRMGHELIFLDTNLKNTRAQHVYELLGFRKIAVNENSWINQLGEPQTSIDYELKASDFCNAKLIG